MDHIHSDQEQIEGLWSSLHNDLRRWGADRQTAEDIAQDTWLIALRSPPEDRRRFRGWLHVVAIRLWRRARTREDERRWRELPAARSAGPMKANLLSVLAAAAVAAPEFAQPDNHCIIAGRLSDGQWAPRFDAVQLRGADGRVIASSSKEALAKVKTAELSRPALLSRCDGNLPLASGDSEPAGTKAQPAAAARGTVTGEAVSFPKLRSGGELVELRVRVPANRLVMLAHSRP